MNRSSVASISSVSRRPRSARLWVGLGALALASTTALAQLAVNTLAGSGSAGSTNGTGAAASFQFSVPTAVAIDAAGNLFIADAGNHVIRQVTSAGVVTTFAGTAGASGSTDATGASARFNGPRGIAIDGAGTLYVADSGNNTIRVVTSGGAVTTLAGTALSSGSTDATGAAARFNAPYGIAADRAGGGGAAVNLFVADSQNHTIRQVVVSTGAVTTLAGTAGASGFVNAAGAAARFNRPDAIAANAAGSTLYVADRFNHVIRQITVSGAAVVTLAGSGTQGQTDATGAAASFDNPAGLALDSSGNVLVSDTFNHIIRSVTSGGVVTTIAGLADVSGTTDGLATNARFNFPTGIAAGASSTFVIDTNNQLVRRLSAAVAPSIATQPSAASAAAGGSANFTVVANATTNPTPTYQWQIQPGGTGSFSNLSASSTYSGVTSATLTVSNVTAAMNGDRFQVILSNGVGSAATSSAAALTVTQAPAFTSATTATFVAGQTTTFTVTASGSPAPTLSATGIPTWASFNTSTGVLTGAPSASDTNATITFTATNSVSSVNQVFTAAVVTTTPPVVTGPTNQSVGSGGTTATFSVSATGTPSTFTYQWERRPSGSGTFTTLTNAVIDGATYSGVTTPALSISGITPAMNGDAYRVVVSSTGGTTTSSVATLSVAPVITSPNTYTFVTGQNNDFNFTATGNPAPTIVISVSGSLPSGIAFNAPTLSGTPTDSSASTTFITVSATNSGGTATQSFTLNVAPPQVPTITSAANATFNLNQAGTFTFTATGSPSPTFQLLGSLPSGLSLNSTTGVLSGTPTATTGSPFTLTVQANNSAGTATQTFVLTVLGVAPTITTHPASATANIGQSATFTAAATGTPTPTLRWQRQPSGTSGFIALSDDATYSGTTSNTLTVMNITAGMSLDQFRLVATNGTSPDATSNAAQLTVNLGTVISTIAGQAGFVGGTDGSGSAARFSSPAGMAVDSGGNVYIADTANHVIRKMTASGIVSTVAGLAGFTGSTDGTTAEARFNSPQGVAVDGAGNVYVADTFNHTIRMISPLGTVSTIAGTAGASGAVDANGSTARFFGPTSIVVDNSGNLYVADSSNHAIRRISLTRDVSTFAGVMGSLGYADGTGSAARFALPGGLALDGSGNLYLADSFNHVIRRVTAFGVVTTLAGVAGSAGVTDGIGANARFNRPSGTAVDGSGNLYIADTFSSTIRKLVIATGDVTTLAGLALSTGFTDGAGGTARFNQPIGIAVDSSGTLYIADTRNHTIRRSGSPTAPQIQTHPSNQVAGPGLNASFTAAATGAPLPGYQWQRAAAATPDSYVNLTNDGTYSGVTTATLTVTNATIAMSGDRFRVVANNGVSPAATSNAATLTIGTAPVFTSASSAQFQAGRAGSFNVTVTSDPAATFGSTNLPSWATLNSSTGEITGTPPDTSGSPFTVTIAANNGITVTQTLTITVLPAVLPPVIANQPASVAVGEGQTATLSVSATGTTPFTYQWRHNGAAINGATGATLSLTNVQASSAGIYSVVIQNSAGSVVSNGATVTVNTPPAFTLQPFSQVAVAGGSVTFSVAATGSSTFSYQWRRNGTAIAGANGASLTLPNVSATDAGNYDVLVTNDFGTVRSSLAQLTIVAASVAPVIQTQPTSRAVLAGSSVLLNAAASGAPTPTYQWRRNGVAIVGATAPAFTIPTAQASDAGNYDVVVSNSVGTVVSNAAVLRVVTRSYAGGYFGTFANSLGSFALYVRDDNSAVFLGYLPGATAPVLGLNVIVNDDGSFSFGQGVVTTSASPDEHPRAASLAAVNVSGTIATNGNITGSINGGANADFGGVRVPDSGASQAIAGFYQAGANTSGAQAYTIVGANGQAFVVVQSATTADGGVGTASGAGQVTLTTSRSAVSQSISGGFLLGTSTGAVVASYSGAADVLLARQRLVNISTRARVGTGDAVAIAGFVISGEQSKPVLIRAVGPTLGAAPFSIPGVLASPRLELFRGSTSLAVNTGIAANRAVIDAAGQQAGAFALGSAGTDAAILTTLAPGNYTAIVSSTTNTAGVALIEVYDLSAAVPGQKLLNISTRASAGTAENTLIAGFVVPPGASKRVLVRGIGPGLTPLGVTGVLPAPTLTLIGGTAPVQNSNWSTSVDAPAISAASAQVGAFAMANTDAAMIVTLAPGNYTAQVAGANNATGVALIEVYELP